MGEWPIVTLKDVCEEITVGHVGPMADQYLDEGIPFLRSLSVEPYSIKTDGLKFISQRFHEKLSKSILKPGDVVIVRTGRPGACAVIPKWLEEANCSDLVIIRCGPQLRPNFLCYVVNSIASQHIETHLVGAVQQHFNVGSAKTLKFGLPSIEKQDEILSLLSALDDKIELNRQMNETLEAMARAIFRDWFVDFGPTRAKQEGRPPYLAPELWALFPDRLDDEGKPEGWESGKLRDILELSYGKALKASDRIVGDIPVYGSGGITGYHNKALVKGPSIIVGRKGTVGSLYWEDKDFFPIDTVFYVQSKISITYCYYLLQTLGLENLNTDAAVPGLNRNNAYDRPIFIVPNKLINAFDEIVGTFRNKIQIKQQENQYLSRTRDMLLPKLMSGELELPTKCS